RTWGGSEALPPEQRGYRGVGKIDPYIPYLRTRLAEGCTNQSRLWREIHAQGFTGTRSLVAKWIRGHGPHPAPAPRPAAPHLPAARQLAWLLVQDAARQSDADQALVAPLQQHPALPHVQPLVQQGMTMIRQRQAAALDAWLQAWQASPSVELRNCAEGLRREDAAVHAARALPSAHARVH